MSPTPVLPAANATISDLIVSRATATDPANSTSPQASNTTKSNKVNTAAPLKVTDLCHFILGILHVVSFTLVVACGSIAHHLGKKCAHEVHRNEDESQTTCSEKADRQRSNQPWPTIHETIGYFWCAQRCQCHDGCSGECITLCFCLYLLPLKWRQFSNRQFSNSLFRRSPHPTQKPTKTHHPCNNWLHLVRPKVPLSQEMQGWVHHTVFWFVFATLQCN